LSRHSKRGYPSPRVPTILFHISHKEAYRGSDIKVTYILLYITYFSELISVAARLNISSFSFQWWKVSTVWRLMGIPPFPFIKVEQHSLIGILDAKEKKNWLLASIAGGGPECCSCQDLLQQRWFGRNKLFRRGKDISSLVIAHAEDAWMNSIEYVESYWKLSDSRGHWTLERNGCQEMAILWDSLEKPFDQSVILFAITTRGHLLILNLPTCAELFPTTCCICYVLTLRCCCLGVEHLCSKMP